MTTPRVSPNLVIAAVILALLGVLALSAPVAAQLGRLPRPERVLLIGSSSIHHGFGDAVADALTARGGIAVVNAGRSATGLARPDFYDWLAAATEQVRAERPDLVIAQFGGNDCQAILDADGGLVARWGDDGWDGAYAARLEVLVGIARDAGSGFVFVGMPRMESPSFSRKIEHLNGVVRDTAARLGVPYVSSWELTSDGDRPRATLSAGGHTYDMREEDGIHLSVRGSELVAAAFLDALGAIYDLQPLQE